MPHASTGRRLVQGTALALVATVASALVVKWRVPVVDDPTADEVSLVSVFGGSSLRPTSSVFRGGSTISMFGGTKLDLRRVTAALDGARMRSVTVFGGTEVTVPEGWRVDVTGRTLFGGTRADGIDGSHGGPPELTIEAVTVFGGLSVAGRPVLRAAEMRA
jgi:hypothetical protein